MNKFLKIFNFCFKFLFIIFVVFFSLSVLMQRFSNNNVSLFGFRIFAVATGSMEPVYHVGDVILVKNIDVNKIKVGDDVTYLGMESSFKDKVITHRVKKIIEKDGSISFLTQGVATTSVDPLVSSSQIYGKVAKKLVIFSLFHSITSKPSGFFILIILPLMILIGSEIVQTLLEKSSKVALSGACDGNISVVENNNNNVICNNVSNNVSNNDSEKEALIKELNELKLLQLKQELESLQKQVEQNNSNNNNNGTPNNL